jgi:hypothetical protein
MRSTNRGAPAALVSVLTLTLGAACTGTLPPASERTTREVPASSVETPASATGPVSTFSECPVTLPNGRVPPGERPSPQHHGEGEFYTALWATGVVLANRTEPYSSFPAGWLEMKWPWHRPQAGASLEVSGVRIDGPAEPLGVSIPDGYRERFQASTLGFPSEGCWEITAKSSGQTLRFVVLVRAQ